MDKQFILKNKNFYPECYIPQKLLNSFEGNLKALIEESRPKFNELEPRPPKLPEKPDLSEMVLLIPTFIGLFFYFKLFVIVIFVIIIVVAFRYIKALNLYPKLIENYSSELSFYETSMGNYQQTINSFKNRFEKYDSDLSSYKFINSLIAKEIKETFESSPEPNVCFQSPQKGRSENFFKSYLVEYFAKAIRDDCTIEIFEYSKKIDFDFDFSGYEDNYIDVTNCYVPDFCFIHPTKSLKIDIEIDEPYTYKKQIHYISSDRLRNKYFIDKNWIVLRFSEQQVQKAPKECCREIAEIIYRFTNDASYIHKLLNASRLTRLKKWTLEDATNLITINHRQHYPELENHSISIDFINGVWEDEEICYEFVGSFVKKVLKQRPIIKSAWKTYSGIFYLTKKK